MACYRLEAQIIGRGDGHDYSSVKAAAYRAGEKLFDETKNKWYDYSNRKGVVHSEVMLPKDTDPSLSNRHTLWNTVERMEKRCDSQLCREILLSLPHEMKDEQRIELVRGFISDEFTSSGMIADFALHNPVLQKGDDPRHYHAHIMLTLRQGTPNGLCSTKTRAWNSQSYLKRWREKWAEHQNCVLEQYGHPERVSNLCREEQAQRAKKENKLVEAVYLEREKEIPLKKVRGMYRKNDHMGHYLNKLRQKRNIYKFSQFSDSLNFVANKRKAVNFGYAVHNKRQFCNPAHQAIIKALTKRRETALRTGVIRPLTPQEIAFIKTLPKVNLRPQTKEQIMFALLKKRLKSAALAERLHNKALLRHKEFLRRYYHRDRQQLFQTSSRGQKKCMGRQGLAKEV